MANKSKAEVIATLRDGVSRRAGAMTRAVDKFQRAAKLRGVDERWRRFNTTLSKTSSRLGRVGRHLGGIAAVAGTALGAGAASRIIDLDARLNQLGIDAGMNAEKLAAFKVAIRKEIEQAATAFNVESNSIIEGIEAVVQKTGDLDFARKNILNLATAISATSGSGGDFGKVLSELSKADIRDSRDVLRILDMFVQQGQQGSFVMRDFANLSERAFAAFSPQNIQQMREMGAILQLFQDATGSPEQTLTSAERFIAMLSDAKKIKKLQEAGVRVLDPEAARRGVAELRPLPDILKSIAEVTGGDKIKLSGMIDETLVRKGLSVFLNQYRTTGNFNRLDKLLAVDGTGAAIAQDAADNIKTTKAKLRGVNETAGSFFAGIADILAGNKAEVQARQQNVNLNIRLTSDGKIMLGGVNTDSGLTVSVENAATGQRMVSE